MDMGYPGDREGPSLEGGQRGPIIRIFRPDGAAQRAGVLERRIGGLQDSCVLGTI